METVADLIFLGSKITADGDCSREIKRCSVLGRKALTNLDSILKSRDITLSTKVWIVKSMVFPVVMYECESSTIKKVEYWRIDACELWCWRRLLRVPWMAFNPKENQPWIFIGRTDAEAEALMLWPPDMKSRLIGKDLDAGKDWGHVEKRREQRMSWLVASPSSMDMSLSKLWELVINRETWHAVVHGVTKSRTRLRDWTELNFF